MNKKMNRIDTINRLFKVWSTRQNFIRLYRNCVT